MEATENCLAHAIIIAISKAENVPVNVGYRRIHNIRSLILVSTCLELGISVHFREYKITVYQDLACNDIMFEEQVDSPKRINLLYDDVE